MNVFSCFHLYVSLTYRIPEKYQRLDRMDHPESWTLGGKPIGLDYVFYVFIFTFLTYRDSYGVTGTSTRENGYSGMMETGGGL